LIFGPMVGRSLKFELGELNISLSKGVKLKFFLLVVLVVALSNFIFQIIILPFDPITSKLFLLTILRDTLYTVLGVAIGFFRTSKKQAVSGIVKK